MLLTHDGVTGDTADAVCASDEHSDDVLVISVDILSRWVKGKFIGKEWFGEECVGLDVLTGEIFVVKQIELQHITCDDNEMQVRITSPSLHHVTWHTSHTSPTTHHTSHHI